MKILALWMLAITLSIDPSTYTITFTPSPDNAEVWLVIEGNYEVNPYYQINSYPVDGTDSRLVIPRRSLPRGSYTIYAGMYQWNDCELYIVESSPTLIVRVP